MRGTGFWWHNKLYTVRKWIATQKNVMAVTEFISLSPWLPTQCLNQLIYLSNPGLLPFCVLTTSQVISGWLPTCDSANTWCFYSATPLEDQAAKNMTWYHTQSHYPDTELSSYCLILLMQSTKLDSDKYKFSKPLVWLDQESNSRRSRPWILRSTNLSTA